MKSTGRFKVLEINVSNNDNNEHPRQTRSHKIRYEQNVPHQFANSLMPLNAFEQKDRFLRRKLTPEFHLNVPTSELESALLNASGNITFTLFREATRILDIVCKRFKSIDNFVEQSFGPRISVEEATAKITEYIKESNLPTNLDVIWCEDLIGSALMCSTGMDKNGNIPRHRKFTMLLKTNEENTYLREKGIICLMDHELGTHYHRSFNEGLQPWYGKREIYGLGSTNTCEAVKIEEGLACIHTVLRAEYRYLGVPALLYYGSCMAEYLPFKDLFEHLGKYVANEEQRWKHCMRIKRCLPSQDRCGGYGKDQRYFEGAITILRQQANIDFQLLMAGKLTLDELDRARRCAFTAPIRLPTFMLNKEKYTSTLRQIARLNGVPIAKSITETPRSRSVRAQSDTRCPPVPASSMQVNTTPSFNSSLPSCNKPSNQSLMSEQAGPETEGQGSHKKHTRPNLKPLFPAVSKSQSESSTTVIGKTPVTQKTTPKLEKMQSSDHSVEWSLTPSSGNCDMQAGESDEKGLQNAHQAIKSHIIRALNSLELPVSRLSNAVVPQTNQDTNEQAEQNKSLQSKLASFGRFTSRVSVVHNIRGLQNGLSTLPEGVCGCRLFTHGHFRAIGDETQNTDRSTERHQTEAKQGNQYFHYEDDKYDPPGIRDVQVPMILEVDLRHPLIGV